MKFFTLFLSWFFIALCYSGPVKGLICPTPEVLYPCSCKDGKVLCAGYEITQGVIDRTIATIRTTNDLLPSDWLNLTSLTIQSTDMTHLDLTSFITLNLDELFIGRNSKLTFLSGPGGSEGSIDVKNSLKFFANDFTDETFGDALKYFAPTLRVLDLMFNRFKGTLGLEFLPGLSRFTQLESLLLQENQITNIGGGQFASNNQLLSLVLAGNQIEFIGENAFIFNPVAPHMVDIKLTLHLHENQLNDAGMNNLENGLLNINRPLQISLGYNNLQFLSAGNFENLLKANDQNFVDLYLNPLICDERMKWLHDQKNILEMRVINANCTNDPGYDVFHTSLIS